MKIQKFIFGSRRATVGWNTGSQFAGKAVSAGVMFLISLMIARKYGAAGFGDFTKITTYVAFYYLLADFGLNAIYLQREQKTQNNWGALLGLRLTVGLLLMLLSLFIVAILPGGNNQGYTGLVKLGIVLYSPTILLQGLITTVNALFQKHLRYDLSTIALVAGNLVSLILVVALVRLGTSAQGVVFVTNALLAGTGLTVLASFILARRWWSKLKFAFEVKLMKQLLISAVPLGLMLIFNQVYFRFDSFVLTLTRPTAEVGLYGLAYKIFELPLVIPTFFMNALYPVMLAAKTKEAITAGVDFQNLVKKSFIFLTLFSLLLAFLFWFAAPLLAFIRPEFSQSVIVLRILVLSLPFFFITSLFMWLIIALEKQVFLPLVYGFSMIFIIIADVLFIPKYGYPAAAWITVAAEGIVLLLLGSVIRLLIYGGRQNKINGL